MQANHRHLPVAHADMTAHNPSQTEQVSSGKDQAAVVSHLAGERLHAVLQLLSLGKVGRRQQVHTRGQGLRHLWWQQGR